MAAGLLGGCGYVGDPQPPALLTPRAVEDLAVAQRGDKLVLSFTLPARTVEDLPLARLGEVEVYAGPNPHDAWDADQWAAGARRLPVAGAAPGAQLKVETPAEDWAGQEVFCAVRVANHRGRLSSWSNFPSFTVVTPLARPVQVAVRAVAAGVEVRWTMPQARDGVSYLIRRRAGGEQEATEVARAAASPWVDPDTRYGTPYEYTVQAVTKAGEAEAVSLESAPASVSPVDTFAPAAPAGLTVLAGASSIEVSWSPATEPDFAAYRLYRAEGEGDWVRIAELAAAPSFSDRAAERGKRYRYTVTAVDRLGNESARPAPVEIEAP